MNNEFGNIVNQKESIYNAFEKAHVKATTVKTKSGKLVNKKEYDDIRTKRSEKIGEIFQKQRESGDKKKQDRLEVMNSIKVDGDNNIDQQDLKKVKKLLKLRNIKNSIEQKDDLYLFKNNSYITYVGREDKKDYAYISDKQGNRIKSKLNSKEYEELDKKPFLSKEDVNRITELKNKLNIQDDKVNYIEKEPKVKFHKTERVTNFTRNRN